MLGQVATDVAPTEKQKAAGRRAILDRGDKSPPGTPFSPAPNPRRRHGTRLAWNGRPLRNRSVAANSAPSAAAPAAKTGDKKTVKKGRSRKLVWTVVACVVLGVGGGGGWWAWQAHAAA